jgi:carboxyl-terminal processing protease
MPAFSIQLSKPCKPVKMQEHPRHIIAHYRSSLLVGAVIGLCIGCAFAGGFFIRGVVDIQTIKAASASEDPNSYPLVDEVQTLLDQYYLHDQPSVPEREYAAVRGILSALNDPYTFFVDPPVAQSESDVLAGTYGGIGVQVRRSEQGKLILFPFKDSPALIAGVQEGDELIAVNQSPVTITVQADVVDQMLRGEVKEGNGVELTIIKNSTKAEVKLFIPFAVISIPSVVSHVIDLSPSIGYLQILLFTSRTPSELQDALIDLEGKNVSALILDLRNNSGGLLQESVKAASEFLEEGIVVYERTNNSEKALNVQPGGKAIYLPLVVLINQGTASAAELVAGAIRDRNRGILVGQTTYGKGSVQQIFRLSDGSSLHVTAAEWLTPKREHLDGVGLQPDIVMIPDVNGRDVELGEALRYLKGKLAR